MDDVFIKVEELNHPPSPDEEEAFNLPPLEPPNDAKTEVTIEKEKDKPKEISKTELKPEVPVSEQQKSGLEPEQPITSSMGTENTEQLGDLPPDAEVQGVPQTTTLASGRSGVSLMLSQTLGLFIKNFKIIYRNKGYILLQALIPILLTIGIVVAGSRFLEIPDDVKETILPQQRVLKLNLDEYKNPAPVILFYSEPNASTLKIGKAYEQVIGQHQKQIINKSNPESDFLEVIGLNGKKYVVGVEILNETELIAWHSDVAIHAAPLSINLLSNALLRSRTLDSTSNEPFEIKTSIHPFVDTKPKLDISRILIYPTTATYKESAHVFGSLVAFLWSIVMAIFVTNFVVEPTLERISSGKLLQFMTGVNPIQYWCSFFFTDFILTFVIILIMITLVFTFEDYEAFTKQDGAWALLLIFVVYCTASIPFAYLYSTFVKSTEEGYKRILCTHLFTGTILAIMSYIFQIISIVYTFPSWPFQILGRIFPGYSLIRILFTYGRSAYNNLECHVIPKRYLSIVCDNDFDYKTVTDDKLHAQALRRCCDGYCYHAKPTDYNMFGTFLLKDFLVPCVEWHPYLEWYDTTLPWSTDTPGSIYDLITLILLSIVYFIFILLVDYGLIMKSAEMLGDELYPATTVNDEDVIMEGERVRYMVETGLTYEDALVVSMLSKAFGQFWAVSGLSFGVHYGECFGLLGVNGAGKTTAFKMLTGDAKKSFGEAFMGSLCLSRSTKQFMSRVGYCPQFDGIIEVLSGREMLYLFGRLRGLQGKQLTMEVDKWLKRTGLKSSENIACGNYSGGMKRRLSTGMALIGDPPVILLDEPTSGVDPVARRRFWKIIGNLKNSGQAIILTSHSMEECEALCNRLGIMVNGEMQCFGGVQHLKNKYAQGYSMTVKLYEDFVHPKPKEIPPALVSVPSQMQGPPRPGQAHPMQPQASQMRGAMGKTPMQQQMPPQQQKLPQKPPQQNYNSMASKVGAQLGHQPQQAEGGALVENPEIDDVIQSIIDTFESCDLKDRHMGTLKFQIYDVEGKPPLTYDVLYAKMEETLKKHEGKVEEYAIVESTLEDVFLAFAKLQYNNNRGEASETCGKLRRYCFCC